MKILVSACLLGCPCRYDGQGKKHPEVEALRTRGHELIPVCPEVQGGLPTPRPPAERQRDGRVVNREGTDVTESYQAFSRRLIPGDGVTAQQLRQAGIKVLGESQAETIQ